VSGRFSIVDMVFRQNHRDGQLIQKASVKAFLGARTTSAELKISRSLVKRKVMVAFIAVVVGLFHLLTGPGYS
jgi:molybdenum cofactor biosynthesis enzyme